ncbi:MAG: DNA repair exonuclease [Nanoarchaeota archaeon]|nr:DNA repair exonuclease [Nanoarchaeota archaeon]
MKFIHVGDTHLGKNEGKIEKRVLDFYNAFKQVVDFAIEENVDFVVHSGDLFDKARPSVKTIVFAIKQLERLKQRNIPFLIVPGSHDIGVGETILSVLEEVGLLKNLASSKYISVENNKIVLSGENIKDCFICGLPGKRARIEEVYKNLKINGDGKYKIFVFHHTISKISEKFSDIPTSLLPKGFDYYAGGHWHGFFKTNYDNGVIVYPGSTEYCDLDEMERDKNKYFCLVELNDDVKIKSIPIKTRPIIIKEINCNNIDAVDVANLCINSIDEIKENAILIFKLKGRLSKGTKSEINREKILNWAKEKGFLITKIYMGELENPETPFVSVKFKTPSEIEDEYLKKLNYNEEEVKLAKDIIRILGKSFTPKEYEVAKKQMIDLIEGVFLADKKN